MAARLQTEEVIEELRSALAGLAMQAANDDRGEQGAEIASLVARLDELAAHVGEVAQREIPDVFPRLDELSARIEDVAAAIPVVETDVLAAKIESLEEMSRTGSGALEHLATEIGELESRTQQRLDALSSREAEIASLVARLDELAAHVGEVAQREIPDVFPRLDELSARIEDVAATIPVVETDVLAAKIESLEEMSRTGSGALEHLATEIGELESRTQQRLDALSSREPDLVAIAELRARVDDLVAAVEREPDTAPFDEVRARLDELSAAVDRDSDSAAIDELRLRVNLLAATVERESDRSALDVIRARVEALATAVELGEELREELQRAAESTLAERESFAQAVFARVEEVAATAPREDELAEIRARLDELAARPTFDGSLQERVDGVAARLEGSAPRR